MDFSNRLHFRDYDDKETLFRDIQKNLSGHGEFIERTGIRPVDFGDKWLEAEMPVVTEVKNSWGTAHGGAIYALADTCAGLAAILETKCICVTLNSSISFLANVPSGTLYARADMLRCGRRTAVAEVRIAADDGTLVARATFTFCPLAD